MRGPGKSVWSQDHRGFESHPFRPMNQIEEIKSKVDIVELINEYVPLKKRGRNFQALCPFHSEKVPSFNVSPELQIWKCFGCGQGGDIFKFLMEYEKMDFGEALRFLADRAGIKLERYRPTPEEAKKKLLLEINHLASEFYHYLLTQHQVGQTARDYLKKRGINPKTITTFKLGYAPQMWDGLIKFLVNKKKYHPADLEAAGLIIKRQPTTHNSQSTTAYYDRFRARLIFPLLDHRDNVLGFAGRTLKPKVERAKYINTPETILYHKANLLYGLNLTKNEIKKKNEAVLVEGEFDALSSWQVGVKNVVAIKGSALTLNQAKLLRRFTENVLFALDADSAGDEAVRRGISVAEIHDLNLKIALPLYGKDPDECCQHSAQVWRQSLKKAVNIYDFYFDSTFRRFDSKTPAGLKKISQELLPLLNQIRNKIVQNHYLRRLAQKIGVDQESVANEMDRLKSQKLYPARPEQSRREPAEGPKKTRRELIEEYLLNLTLQEEDPSQILKKFTKIKVKNPAVAKILKQLKKFLSSHRRFDLKKFIDQLPAELQEIARRLYLQEQEKPRPAEIEKLFLQLQQMAIKEALKDLAQKISQAEKAKDEKKTQTLQKKYNLNLSRLREFSSQNS